MERRIVAQFLTCMDGQFQEYLYKDKLSDYQAYCLLSFSSDLWLL